MRFLRILVIFIYTLAFAVTGGLLISLAFNLLTLQNLQDLLGQLFQIQNIQLIVGGVGLFLIVVGFWFAQVALGKMQREKTIAFNNPDGQVTVSLSAIEEFIKRLGSSLPEIKDLRSSVIAGKKAIEITCRVSLWSDANIPQTTENIQTIIKGRIQEMLGIEEPTIVRVHVVKIVPKDKKRLKKAKLEEGELAPFRGSIEYGKD